MHFTKPLAPPPEHAYHLSCNNITATKTKEQAHPPECNALCKTLGTTTTT
jgi:hypothetical protein